MEALAAISLAANIIQFVDFGTKVTSKALEYRQSLTGRLKDHLDLESTLDDLNKLLYKLEHDAEIRGASSPSDQMAALLRQLKICSNIGADIRILLDRAKVNRSGFFKSYRKAFRAVWSQSALESLLKRLSAVQQQVQLNLSVEQREQLRAICKSQNDIVSSLDHVGQCILRNILEGRDALLIEQGVLALQMATSHQEAMTEIASGFDRLEKLMQSLATEFRGSQVAIADDNGPDQREANEEFLDTLRFRSLEARYGDIEDAYLNTLKWALSESFDVRYVNEEAKLLIEEITGQLGLVDEEREELTWSLEWDLKEANLHASGNLSQWLRMGQGIFWIWGKPGCGKSTLMKFLLSQDRYSNLLKEWAHPYPITIASCFLWKAGATLQKSLIGLLLSLLRQILKQRPELVADLFRPSYRSSIIARRSHETNDDLPMWTLEELIRTFKNIRLRQDLRLCVHIDGLDEYEGNPRDLLDLISTFVETDNIKVLCASRWKRVYEKGFSGSQYLAMHQLTWSDLARYTIGQCLADSDMRRVMSKDPTGTKRLVLAIVAKAKGVFLWVKTVVQSLIDGCANFETTRELMQRVDELPADILRLYSRILDEVEPRYRSDISFWLLVAGYWNRIGSFDIDTHRMLFACNYDTRNEGFFVELSNKDLKQIEYESQRLGDQIRVRCPNFFSLGRFLCPGNQINFIHRTVLEFLEQSETMNRLISTLEGRAHPFIAVAAASMGQRLRLHVSPGHIRLDEYVRILMAERSLKISVDPLRDQLWYYLVRLQQMQAGREFRNQYCMIPSRSGWMVSTVSDFHKQAGPLEPLLLFLESHDTDYVLKRVVLLGRPLGETEIFWVLYATILTPSWVAQFHKHFDTREEGSLQHQFGALAQRFSSDYLSLISDVLWKIFVDQLYRVQMHLSRYIPPNDVMSEHFNPGYTTRTYSSYVELALVSDKVITGLIQPGTDLNLLRTSIHEDCDRTIRSASSLLKVIASKAQCLDGGSTMYGGQLKRSTHALSSRGAKEITRRPRRWSLPLPAQIKAFQGISHTQAHDTSPFQTRSGPIASQHERRFLAPRDRRRVLLGIRHGEILHRTSSFSHLKKNNILETQYTCHSEFRSWADLQHVLIEQGHIDRHGLPVDDHKGFSSFFKGVGNHRSGHEEYHTARYGRSALILPLGMVRVKLVRLNLVCDVIINKARSSLEISRMVVKGSAYLAQSADPDSSAPFFEALRVLKRRLKYLHNLLGSTCWRSTEYFGLLVATMNNALDALPVFAPKERSIEYNGPGLQDFEHSLGVVEELIREIQELGHDTECPLS